MTRQRADLGFADELDSFDPGSWTPAAPVNDRAQRPEAQQAATAAGFRSREPRQQEPLRRRRTGRNTQFNIKARPETIEAFCQIADANGWGFGETLEHAVALLQREHLSQGGSGQK